MNHFLCFDIKIELEIKNDNSFVSELEHFFSYQNAGFVYMKIHVLYIRYSEINGSQNILLQH